MSRSLNTLVAGMTAALVIVGQAQAGGPKGSISKGAATSRSTGSFGGASSKVLKPSLPSPKSSPFNPGKIVTKPTFPTKPPVTKFPPFDPGKIVTKPTFPTKPPATKFPPFDPGKIVTKPTFPLPPKFPLPFPPKAPLPPICQNPPKCPPHCPPIYCPPHCWPFPIFTCPTWEVVIGGPACYETQVVAEVVQVAATPAAPVVSPIDLELVDVLLIDAGSALEKAGPRYRVTVRNSGSADVTKSFNVLLVAANGQEFKGELPSAGQRVEQVAAGKEVTVDVRLPFEALQMGIDDQGQLQPFSTLVVAVDNLREVADGNEQNNAALLPRTNIQTIKTGG